MWPSPNGIFFRTASSSERNPNGILFHWNNPSSHAKPVFSRSCFLSGTCQNAEPKSNVVKNFAIPSLERLSSMRGIGYANLYRHCVQITEIITKPELPPFFLAMTTPQAHGVFEGSIMSYFINISISFLHASDLFPSCTPCEVSSPLLSQSRVLQIAATYVGLVL